MKGGDFQLYFFGCGFSDWGFFRANPDTNLTASCMVNIYFHNLVRLMKQCQKKYLHNVAVLLTV